MVRKRWVGNWGSVPEVPRDFVAPARWQQKKVAENPSALKDVATSLGGKLGVNPAEMESLILESGIPSVDRVLGKDRYNRAEELFFSAHRSNGGTLQGAKLTDEALEFANIGRRYYGLEPYGYKLESAVAPNSPQGQIAAQVSPAAQPAARANPPLGDPWDRAFQSPAKAVSAPVGESLADATADTVTPALEELAAARPAAGLVSPVVATADRNLSGDTLTQPVIDPAPPPPAPAPPASPLPGDLPGGGGGEGPVIKMERRRRNTVNEMRRQRQILDSEEPGQANREAANPQFLQVVDRLLSAPDFGAGGIISDWAKRAAQEARGANATNLAGQLERAGGAAEFLLPAAAGLASVGVPLALAASSGNEQAGSGGAAINAAGAGLGMLAGSGMGPVGRIVGGLAGGALGGGVTGMAQGLVTAKQQGDTGLRGQLGAALDPMIMSEREMQERQLMAEINSPAVQALQERNRQERHNRNMEMLQAALIQSYLA